MRSTASERARSKMHSIFTDEKRVFNFFNDLQHDAGRPIVWPEWVEILTNVSHLMTTFNSSVNFYIYLAKHWRMILGRPASNASERTEMTRLRTSVVVHDNHHYPPILHNSTNTRHHGNSLNISKSGHHHQLQKLRNHDQNAVEETRMLVNVIVSAPNDDENDTSTTQTTRNGEVHC